MPFKLFRTVVLATALGSASLCLGTPAWADAASDSAAAVKMASAITTSTDFVNTAAWGDKFEIDSSNLALGKSADQRVKDFATALIADHSKSSNELLNAAKAAGLSVTPPVAHDPRHQPMIDALTQIDGKDFDAQYLDDQLHAHEEAVALFTAYSNQGDNAKLKDFATKLFSAGSSLIFGES